MTHIHPFADGNGRVARALASLFCDRAYGLPIIVYSDRKQTYFQALEAADKGNPQMFVDYIADRMLETVARAGQEAQVLAAPSVSETLAGLMDFVSGHKEISISSVTQVAAELLEYLHGEVDQQIRNRLSGESGDLIEIHNNPQDHFFSTAINLEAPFRANRAIALQLRLKRPIETTTSAYLTVGTPIDLAQRFTFCIASSNSNSYMAQQVSSISAISWVELRFEDVFPKPSTSAASRISLLVDATIRAMLDNLRTELHKALRQAGHDAV